MLSISTVVSNAIDGDISSRQEMRDDCAEQQCESNADDHSANRHRVLPGMMYRRG